LFALNNRIEIQTQMGIDLHSVKQFILQKTISDDLLNPEEEKLIDTLNRLV